MRRVVACAASATISRSVRRPSTERAFDDGFDDGQAFRPREEARTVAAVDIARVHHRRSGTDAA